MPPTMISKSAGPAPTQAEISDILNTIFDASSSDASISAAYTLCDLLLNSVGFRGLHAYGILTAIKKAAADKKSGLKRESAQNLLGALFERLPPSQRVNEVVLLLQDGGMVGVALDALSDKGPVVREAAQYGLDELFKNLSAESLVHGLLPALASYLDKRSGKWQGSVGAFKLMQRMADKSKMEIGGRHGGRC